ncbi:unnamed protein product [Mytilus edulis]|uniref:Uncharacterized protein n=1 Tax=Mytilus edulis TaxID=6550 RepID=A0A8S3QQX5_MYTED|nr:unnamed protein product [Mytilus edulis]
MNEQIDKEKSLKIKKNEDRLKEMANERNQEIQRVVKMEQNIKDLQHKIEKEAEERVEDKTFHAETKTKNTKVHVESAVEDNYTQTEEYLKRKTENSHHRDTCDLLIIGSSIIKDIDGKRLYKNRKVKIITLHDKTVFGAIQYIKSFRDKAKHIMFQIGSNDIEQKTPDEVIEEVEELVRVTQRYNPDATITFGEILPRFLSDRYYAKFFNEHRLIFNVQLYELCKDLDLHFVRYDFIQPDYFVDGIHIKGHGIPIMVMSIKRVLNTLLNVKLWENNEYNTKTNHVRDNGIPNYQMTNSMTNRKQRDHQAFEQKSHFHNPIYVGSESAINGRNKTVNMMELMLQEMRTGLQQNKKDLYAQMSNCYKNLSISSWNVHGLGDKLKDELFIENLKGDINILLETWKGESKEFKLEGHCIISKSRKKRKKARRYSGGIIVTIKKPYFKGITYLKEATTSPNRLWLKLNKNFFGFVHDIYLCALYIPPFSSSHYDNDLDFLENEISTFSMNGQIVLIGDLNARTGQRADFIVNESDHINNFDGFDLLLKNYITDSEINRNNKDTSVNTVGTKLLDLCLSSRLRLLNGRFLGDLLGYYTYMLKPCLMIENLKELLDFSLKSVDAQYSNISKNYSMKEIGMTALYMAASLGHKERVRLLLLKGANPCIADINGDLPLHHAVRQNQFDDVLYVILDFFPLTYEGLKNTLDLCNSPALQRKLKQAHQRRQDEIVSPGLLELTMEGNADKLYCLLEEGDMVDTKLNQNKSAFGSWPLYLAIENIYYDVVTLLCEKGADLRKCHQATGNTVLHLAASLGRLDVLEFLLNFCKPKYGVDVGRFLSSKKRLCVNASNGSDKTATDKGFLKPVKCLLNQGATTALLDFNENLFSVPEYEGVWSEILSHRQRHTDLIMNLIEKDSKPNFEKLKKAWVPGFDHNLRDHHANTPLMVACKVGNVDVVLFLLQSAVYPQSFAEDDSLIEDNSDNDSGVLDTDSVRTDCQEGEPHCTYYSVVRKSPVMRSEMTENRKVESLLQDISRPSGLSIYHDGFINHICAVNSMDGSTSLHTCLLKGDNFRIMELLLKIDPNDMTVNIQNISGLTPLHLACQLERRKCTEILVVSILLVFDKLTT